MPVRPISKLSRNDLSNLNAFLAVERLRSFTQAAVELGITTSALSHAVRNLESRLGVRLLNRTSRTVAPTDAGANLARRLDIGFKEISEALDEMNQFREQPYGRLRLSVPTDSTRLVLGKHLPKFLQRYPKIQLEISVEDTMIDIVSAGFDAGIRYGGTIPEDFVAAKLGNELKWVTVASPSYLYHHKEPSVPEDLLSHSCVQLRTGQGIIYRWEFQKGDDFRVIDVPGQVCVNETQLAIELALGGVGVIYCLEDMVKSHLAKGELVTVLPEWATIDPPMYMYYPGHRQVPQGLRELIDTLREEMAYANMT